MNDCTILEGVLTCIFDDFFCRLHKEEEHGGLTCLRGASESSEH